MRTHVIPSSCATLPTRPAWLAYIRQAFEPYSAAELERLLLPHPDHLHLSPDGNTVYAEAIWPAIESAMASLVSEARDIRTVA